MVSLARVARRDRWQRFEQAVQLQLVEDDLDASDLERAELTTRLDAVTKEMRQGFVTSQRYMMGLMGMFSAASLGFALNLLVHAFK